MRDAQISVLIGHAGVTIFPPFSQCPVERLIPVDPVVDLERRVRDGSTELVLAPNCDLVGSCELVDMQFAVVCAESQNERSQLRVISASILDIIDSIA